MGSHLERLLKALYSDDFVTLTLKQLVPDHVRTPEGSLRYGAPIGAPITAKMIQKAKASAGGNTSSTRLPIHPTMASAPKRMNARSPIGRGEPGVKITPIKTAKPVLPKPDKVVPSKVAPNAPPVVTKAGKKPDNFGISDEVYSKHLDHIKAQLDLAFAAGKETDKSERLPNGFWKPEREAQHKQLLTDLMNAAANVPNDRKAVMSGGIGGAGKSHVLGGFAKIDQKQYLTINADDLKEELGRRGMIPDIPGLSPAEASTLVHEEASYLSKQLTLLALAEGKNIIHDVTMASGGNGGRSTKAKVQQLRDAGYDVDAIFVDIPVEKSLERATSRHKHGMADQLAGKGWGGRYLPPQVIMGQKPEHGSKYWTNNREVFEELKHGFNNYKIYDNSVDDRDPILIEEGHNKIVKSDQQQKFSNTKSKKTEPYAIQLFTTQDKELNFFQAKEKLTSDEQINLNDLATKINAQYNVKVLENKDMIGDTAQYGTENSLMQHIVADPQTSRLIAAEKGLAGNQLSVLNFNADDTGKDAILRVPMPKALQHDELRKILDDRGLEFRSIDPNTNELVFFSSDGDKLAEIEKLAEDYSDGRLTLIRGSGEFVGSDQSREAAKKVYRRIIEESKGNQQNQKGNSDTNSGASTTQKVTPTKSIHARNTTGMHPVANDDKVAREEFKKTAGKPIPPAWTDVHIADDLSTAKVLAIGRDSKGRAVSMASAQAMEQGAADKFDRLQEVAKAMPRLDELLTRDAQTNDTAAVAFLMRRMGIRVGSTTDTKAKQQAYGATTLEARHVKIVGNKITFDFVGKKGVQIHLEQTDAELAKVLKHYINGKEINDRLFNTNPTKTMAYIRSATGNSQMKNHDLRTHLANVVALQSIKSHNVQPQTQAEFNKLRNEVGDEVSKRLGNNRTEAIKSYINPAVFLAWSPDGAWL